MAYHKDSSYKYAKMKYNFLPHEREFLDKIPQKPANDFVQTTYVPDEM